MYNIEKINNKTIYNENCEFTKDCDENLAIIGKGNILNKNIFNNPSLHIFCDTLINKQTPLHRITKVLNTDKNAHIEHMIKKEKYYNYYNFLKDKVLLLDYKFYDIKNNTTKSTISDNATIIPLEDLIFYHRSSYIISNISLLIAYALFTYNPAKLNIILDGLPTYLPNNDISCILYWIGRASQAGAVVNIPDTYNLFDMKNIVGIEKTPKEIYDEFFTITV